VANLVGSTLGSFPSGTKCAIEMTIVSHRLLSQFPRISSSCRLMTVDANTPKNTIVVNISGRLFNDILNVIRTYIMHRHTKILFGCCVFPDNHGI